jgi:hypothetical protein
LAPTGRLEVRAYASAGSVRRHNGHWRHLASAARRRAGWPSEDPSPRPYTGDIGPFASPKKLAGYTGLCPFVRQSGRRDDRGPLAKNGPKYLRWALIEAATHAARHPAYRERYEHTKRRLGRQRGSKIARVEIVRELATAIWHMLAKGEPSNPGRSPARPLVG